MSTSTIPGDLDEGHTRIVNLAGGRVRVVPKPIALADLRLDTGHGPLWHDHLQKVATTLGTKAEPAKVAKSHPAGERVPHGTTDEVTFNTPLYPEPGWLERWFTWLADVPLRWLAGGTLVALALLLWWTLRPWGFALPLQ